MPRSASTLTVRVAVVLIAIVAGVFASAAHAATIHACVKPKSGATRIVTARAKCRPGEHKLSWNTNGPRGAGGANGKNGANGAQGSAGSPGAVTQPTVFSAEDREPRALPTGETGLLTKVLPPGSYAVSATVPLAGELDKAGFTQVLCAVLDSPGTTGGGESTVLDLGQLIAPLAQLEAGHFGSGSTLPLKAVLTSGVTSTLTLTCTNFNTTIVHTILVHMQALTVGAVL